MHVVVVGSGTAGVTLALRILQQSKNINVTMIEVGPNIEQKDYRRWLDFVARGQNSDPYVAHKDSEGDVESDTPTTFRLSGSRFLGVGGSTNAWGGWCLRYKPEDFFLKTNTGKGLDWPFDYETLEPFYQKAEVTLWVAGTNKPNPEIPFSLKDSYIIKGLESLGINNFEHLPLARKAGCVTIGTCRYCPVGQRYIVQPDLYSIQRDFSDRFALVQHALVRHISLKSNSSCNQLECWSKLEGKAFSVEGDIFVLAAGAIESPKLLLSSKCDDWPGGLGNRSGHVGKHITVHPLIRVVGSLPDNPNNLEQSVDFPTLACRHFDSPSFQSKGKMFFVHDGRNLALPVEKLVKDGSSVGSVAVELQKKINFELRGFVEVFSSDSNFIGVGSSPGTQAVPKTKVSFSVTEETKKSMEWGTKELTNVLKSIGCEGIKDVTDLTFRADHATSTCRMASHERDGVVDPDLKVFGLDNLFVCSNAVLPNGGAVNPTLTLVALTERLASHISQLE